MMTLSRDAVYMAAVCCLTRSVVTVRIVVTHSLVDLLNGLSRAGVLEGSVL